MSEIGYSANRCRCTAAARSPLLVAVVNCANLRLVGGGRICPKEQLLRTRDRSELTPTSLAKMDADAGRVCHAA